MLEMILHGFCLMGTHVKTRLQKPLNSACSSKTTEMRARL